MAWVLNLLLVIGTVLATIGVAPTAVDQQGNTSDQVHWVLAVAGLGLMVVAVLGQRWATRATDPSGPGDNKADAFSLDEPSQWLTEAQQQLSRMLSVEATKPDEIRELTEKFIEPLMAVRHQLLRSHGSRLYGELVGAVAAAERWLNRAWSAAVDGYTTEVQAALRQAAERLTEALTVLQAHRR